MVGGALVAMTLSPASNLSAIAYALAMLAGSAYLLHIVSEQLSLKLAKTRFSFLALVITAVGGIGICLDSNGIFKPIINLVKFNHGSLACDFCRLANENQPFTQIVKLWFRSRL